MKSTITVLLAVLALLIVNITFSVSNSHAQWQTDVRLTNAPDTSGNYTSHSKYIVSNGNLVHIVWWDKRDGNKEIYYKRSINNGINWGEDTRLTNNTAWSVYPAVSVSASNVHIVWHDTRDGFQEIYYKRSTDEGITWGADTRLTVHTTGSAAYPSVVVSGLLVHVFWHDNRDGNTEIYYKRSTDGGVNWETDMRLTNFTGNSFFPSCEVSGSVVRVAWSDNREGTYQVYHKFSTDAGSQILICLQYFIIILRQKVHSFILHGVTIATEIMRYIISVQLTRSSAGAQILV
ncbi:MAG: sialidase family protein [Ignavibacteriae bacterium]|nr:sialidase family protein [Ignavibacteriota bacterium]